MSAALKNGEAVKRALLAHAEAVSVQISVPVEQHQPWGVKSVSGAQYTRHAFVLVSHDADLAQSWLNTLQLTGLKAPGLTIADTRIAWQEVGCGTAVACVEVLSIEDH